MSLRTPDERKRFAAPEDGEFIVAIGGVEHAYRVDEDDISDLPPHLQPVRTDGGRESCVVCGHPFDRDEHDQCPNCRNGSLDDFATDGGQVQCAACQTPITTEDPPTHRGEPIHPDCRGQIRTDGGHPPGPGGAAQPPLRGRDHAYLGSDVHLCDECRRTFRDLEALESHDCWAESGLAADLQDAEVR